MTELFTLKESLIQIKNILLNMDSEWNNIRVGLIFIFKPFLDIQHERIMHRSNINTVNKIFKKQVIYFF